MDTKRSLTAFLLVISVAVIFSQQATIPASDWPMYATRLRVDGVFSADRNYAGECFESETGVFVSSCPSSRRFKAAWWSSGDAWTSPLAIWTPTPLDAANCALRWRVGYEGGGAGAVRGVAVAGDRLFRGFRDGTVIAYKVSNGEPLWEVKLNESDG